MPDVGDISYDLSFGSRGGLDLTINVTLADAAQTRRGRGILLTGNASDAPVLYDRNGTFLRFRLDGLALTYANNNAWYGRPDAMLAGNPLVVGKPAGKGYRQWVEGYVQYGLSGITPLTPDLYAYGSVNVITSVSAGRELFTNKTREHTGVEDAYFGLVGGTTTASGNRQSFNIAVGRQRYTLANGFLIANTAANGESRAALQANARWAADMLVLGQFRHNTTKLELFYLDPDELPKIDTHSRFAGVNLEFSPLTGLDVGISYVGVPRSSFAYYGPDGTQIGTRKGLQVYDARFNYTLNPADQAGPFFGAEYAIQRNSHFKMDARAGWVEVGYSFPQASWSPTVSYRLARFSGDDPDTATYERWDQTLSGGTGEQWVQGANHFKIVQDSNVIAHRLQARFRPSPKFEVVPQMWAFRADSETNIGGNPALSALRSKTYGYELNVTGKWFVNRNTYVHGHIAYTLPGKAARTALDNNTSPWLSTMLFVRYAF